MESDKASSSRPNGGEGRHSKRSKNSTKFLMVGSVAAAFVVAVVAVLWVWNFLAGAVSGIDAGRYQAVFFTNGQVYFGKLTTLNSEYMKLTDIYYLQTKTQDTKNPQKTSDTQAQDVQLIKLGEEIHGPDDEMIISKQQVLFYENLKPGGKVAKTIDDYKATQKSDD